MSELMRPVSFVHLLQWIQGEYRNHRSVFGVRGEKFFRPAVTGSIALCGKEISVPLGPAAGPHAQLAQNILAAYLAGARFIELKTVQTMDGEELRKCVARPCILAADEGYNVEWSTELTVAEAREEYVKAWFLISVFAKEFNISLKPDFIFNMSVGYSFDGIKSAKIDSYIEGMKDASGTEIWKNCYQYITDNMGMFENFSQSNLDAISPEVSGSITLSTLHGCPRDEIERIADYLITEKGLHTYIKCNPTLLGYKTARRLLDEMGYNYVSFDDHHFNNDLQFDDAVGMLRRLKKTAHERGLHFGVKLTNTFPVKIKRNELPGDEMYMSGRALFPLTINAARQLTEAFNGELPVSYSGGADYFNLGAILETGIKPVTIATSLLKPGGYERFCQLAELTQQILIDGKSSESAAVNSCIIDPLALNLLTEKVSQMPRYRKEYRQAGKRPGSLSSRKTASDQNKKGNSAIPLFDCFKAPCRGEYDAASGIGCPIHQNIPAYLDSVASGNYGKAFAFITEDNPCPSITGTLCNHQCQSACTRLDYDDPLEIRNAKLIAADNAQEAFIDMLLPSALKTGCSVGIIGGGPAGIAAAVFLRRNGVPVTVYEKRDKPFGIVQHLIPSFRIAEKAVFRDFRMAQKWGVDFSFASPERYSINELKKIHSFIIIATGAWKEGPAVLKQGKAIDAFRFLEDSKKSDCSLDLGKRVAVIGGGDVAMDCARAAIRNKGVEYAAVVYRRTREFMPSQHEEQELALADGVVFMELLAPESFVFGAAAAGALTCEVMRLGEYDSSGRRSIEGTGEKRELLFDTVIGAIGAGIDTEPFIRNGIALNSKGLPVVNASGETSIAGVYISGDCRAGASTVVKAIADGKAAAADILHKLSLEADFMPALVKSIADLTPDFESLYLKKGVIAAKKQDTTDSCRCLSCNSLCEICADVCPNRANVMVDVGAAGQDGFTQMHQIIHIDRCCNECGNCAVFCPHGGKPYKEKLTLFSSIEDFNSSDNPGILRTDRDTFKIRLTDGTVTDYVKGNTAIPETWATIITVIEQKYGYLIIP